MPTDDATLADEAFAAYVSPLLDLVIRDARELLETQSEERAALRRAKRRSTSSTSIPSR